MGRLGLDSLAGLIVDIAVHSDLDGFDPGARNLVLVEGLVSYYCQYQHVSAAVCGDSTYP